jgi:hypothetical protein
VSGTLVRLVPVAFSDAIVPSRKGDRRALVITPSEHRRVGRDRLRALRGTANESPIETGIVDRITASPRPYQIVVFRGRNDDETASWGFEEALGPDEARELARLLVISHLPTHRCMLTHGTWVMVHTDFGTREADLLRRASQEVLEEKKAMHPANEAQEAVRDADVWLLRHLNFYFSLGFERVIESVLPDKLPLIEMREANVRQLAQSLREHGYGHGSTDRPLAGSAG